MFYNAVIENWAGIVSVFHESVTNYRSCGAIIEDQPKGIDRNCGDCSANANTRLSKWLSVEGGVVPAGLLSSLYAWNQPRIVAVKNAHLQLKNAHLLCPRKHWNQ